MGRNFPLRNPRMRRLAGLSLLLLALVSGCESSQPTVKPPPPTFDLLAWEYPGARPIARMDPELIGSDKVGLEEIAAEPREATRIKAPASTLTTHPTPSKRSTPFTAGSWTSTPNTSLLPSPSRTRG